MNTLTRHSLQDTMTLADAFVQSKFFTDTNSQAQAIVKILAGQELGFGPMASMTGVYIVKGKVSLSANLMAAAVKNSGRYNYRVRELTDTAAEIEFFERAGDGWESLGKSRFTMDDAKAANLLGNATWKQYPRNMLFARAMSNGVKWFTPDIFGAPLYTPDELGAAVDGETGEIIDARVTVAQADYESEYSANGAGITDGQKKALFAIGKKVYGDGWEDKRAQLVRAVTKGRTESAAELTRAEASRIIDGMTALEAKTEGAPVTADDLPRTESLLDAAAAANPESQYAQGA